jgi:hypothetical protein
MRTRILVTVVAAACAALLAGCSCGGTGSGDVDGGDGDGGAGVCDPACEAPAVCRYSTCVPEPEPCTSIDDCPGDEYCDLPAGECLPWGVGPGGNSDDMCTREVVPGVFFPDVQCEWLGPPAGDAYPDHKNILGTPMVADFRAYGDPELGRPSIVFISYNGDDGGSASCIGDNDAVFYGVIRVIDGRSCEQLASIETPHVIASSSLALGDLTGDGIPEIVGAKVGGGVAAWKVNSTGQFDVLFPGTSTFGLGRCNWAGPSLHDLDDDGISEILLHGGVFDAGGNELDVALGTFADVSNSYIPVVADVDRDGLPELVTGQAIYDWDRVNTQWVLQQALGAIDSQTAVADFGTYGADPNADDRTTLDGLAEIVMVNASVFAVYTTTGRVIFNGPLPGASPGNGGPPTIADFDGDGRVELATAGAINYTVFDPDCRGTPDAATCLSLRTDGILWSQPSKDASSHKTGSSVFDFEGDGSAEAVYGDECYLRVYEGATGQVMYSRFRTSCTWYENPVIADTDNDFGAEIIVTSNTNCNVACPAEDPIFDGVRCFDGSDCPAATTCVRDDAMDATGRCRCVDDADCGGDGFICRDALDGSLAGKVCRAGHPGPATAFGLRVVGDKLGRWVDTRGIWNQHAYAVTNVEDSGRIPQTAAWARNWEAAGLNNFRQNSPGIGAGAGLMPDLTVKNGKANCNGDDADFSIEVCNRGTEPVADGVAVSVYDGATAACTTVTNRVLQPGFCTTVYCTVPDATTATDYTIVVDDDGVGEGQHTECREANNSVLVPAVTC